jgi:hypothetical protein
MGGAGDGDTGEDDEDQCVLDEAGTSLAALRGDPVQSRHRIGPRP